MNIFKNLSWCKLFALSLLEEQQKSLGNDKYDENWLTITISDMELKNLKQNSNVFMIYGSIFLWYLRLDHVHATKPIA